MRRGLLVSINKILHFKSASQPSIKPKSWLWLNAHRYILTWKKGERKLKPTFLFSENSHSYFLKSCISVFRKLALLFTDYNCSFLNKLNILKM